MKYSLLFILIGLLSNFNAQNHTISGYLSDVENGEKLIGASIYESLSGSGTTSNVYGFYSITLPSDSIQLRLSYVGYQTQIHKFFLKNDTTINLSFKNNNELDEVLISAKIQEKIQDDSQMSEISIPMQKVKSLPMLLGERDVLKTIQLLPGVQSGSEGGSGMYVRGGGPDQNLILLDGVPIYNASHLFGFFSVFNGDAINSVKLIKGGFPARYGGRLSSVIDLRMKEGNNKKIKGEGGIGLISSRFTLDGPIISKKTSFLISARRTYIDVLAQPFIRAANRASDGSNSRGGYYFYDLNGKVNHKFSEKSRIYASGYFGKDRFYAKDESSDVYNGDEFSYEDESSLKWGNAIAALRWNYVLTPKLFSNVTASYSNYKFSVGFESKSEDRVGGETLASEESFEYFSGIRDYAIKVDFDFAPTPNHLLKFGTGITTHLFKPGINSYFSSFENNNETDTVFGNSNIDALEFAIYVEDDFKINNRLKVNFGIHASGFSVENTFYQSVQPRVSGRYLLNETTSLKASYAQMAQYLHLLSNSTIGLPTDLWLPPTERIKPQLSSQVAFGIAHTYKEKLQISLEGYYKEMDNLLEYKEGASFFNQSSDWQDKVETGKGWSYGGELLIEKKLGNTTGWIGYTLSWSERQFENISFGEKFPYTYDRRHDIGIAVTHKFSERTDMGFVWVYGTGNAVTLGQERYTPLTQVTNFSDQFGFYGNDVEHIEGRNNYRAPAYHRLDISINRHKKTKWGERTWSFGLYNVYSRQNPFYLYFKTTYNNNTRERGLYQISIFPILPSFSYNFKF